MILWTDIVFRLALASVFGALIGLERERRNWAAGLRTHMMVCVGSCLIMLVSAFGFSDILGTKNVTLDPSRIAAQVVSGIGFLGAGTIIFSKQGIIRGLTTASGLWTVAGIGLATGSGMLVAAITTTVIALIILWGLKPIEEKYLKKYRHMTLKIYVDATANHTLFLKELLAHQDFKIQNFKVDKDDPFYVFELNLENIEIKNIDKILSNFEQNPIVKEIFWSQ
ncbi:MAG: MgtC/SapB family protein [Bacteroidetes bacterium]|nr:MgtC/SapB family protein [Bacteroidota bacterium]